MDSHDVEWGTSIGSAGLVGDPFEAIVSQSCPEASLAAPAPACSPAGDADMMARTAALGNPQETFGSLLRTLRFEAELTLGQVASAVGVAKPSVWAWENGKAKPKREKWHALAKVLGVAPNVLASASKAEALNKAASLVMRVEDVDRAGMLVAGREMIAKAYGVSPSAVRIMVEI